MKRRRILNTRGSYQQLAFRYMLKDKNKKKKKNFVLHELLKRLPDFN